MKKETHEIPEIGTARRRKLEAELKGLDKYEGTICETCGKATRYVCRDICVTCKSNKNKVRDRSNGS